MVSSLSTPIRRTLSSIFGCRHNTPPAALWSQQDGSYPPRPGNAVQILIDGQAAYGEIAAAFHTARQFIYITLSYGAQDFLLAPETGETFFDILRSRRKAGVDVRMVVWQPAFPTPDTVPDPAPATIPGVNAGPGSIQARWDKTKGYTGWYRSPHGHFEPVFLDFPAQLGCHHQKTYIMDDGAGGGAAFVGGINPVQAYWDTPFHDVLDIRRVARGKDPLRGLEETPPLHDIFYKLRGPAVGDVMANFVDRYNGASIPYAIVTSDVVAPFTADQIPPVPNGITVQVLRTIAPSTYVTTPKGDRGIRELYLNVLGSAGMGSLVYIENQYFFDHGVISEIHEAAERRAKIIAILTAKPDEGTLPGKVESILEQIANYEEESRLVAGHRNVALLTLGNSRSDPRTAGKVITSETYVHSKTLVGATLYTIYTGGPLVSSHPQRKASSIFASGLGGQLGPYSLRMGIIVDPTAEPGASPEGDLRMGARIRLDRIGRVGRGTGSLFSMLTVLLLAGLLTAGCSATPGVLAATGSGLRGGLAPDTGLIYGRVQLEGWGKAVLREPRTELEFRNEQTGQRLVQTLETTGEYVLVVPSGDYTITAIRSGFRSLQAKTAQGPIAFSVPPGRVLYLGTLLLRYPAPGQPGEVAMLDEFDTATQHLRARFPMLPLDPPPLKWLLHTSGGGQPPGQLAVPSTGTVVPIQLVNNLILVPATLNRTESATLLLDTGATQSLLTPAMATRLGLTLPSDAPRHRIHLLGGQTLEVPFATLGALQVGEAVVENLAVGIHPIQSGPLLVDGLLGGDFLGRFRMTVDRTAKQLQLEPRSSPE